MSVYTELSPAEVGDILAGYDLGALRGLQGIAAGIENSNFFVDTDRGRFVLTIFERMAPEELPWFMRLMCHLHQRGFPCPQPARSRDGTLLFDYGEKRGCIVSCLPGAVVERLNRGQLAEAGATLARLHLAGADFTPARANPTGADWLARTAEQVAEPLAARYGTEAAALLRDELAWQQAQRPPSLPTGIIHGDYFCDNILFDGDRVSGVIDLYYAHSAPWVMDIAIAINALAITLEQKDEARSRALLDGYQARRPLDADELAALPGLLRLAALRFWLSRLFDLFFPRDGAMTQVKDPEEYRHKLRYHRGN
ncbi:MAG: homoserine kinase [Zetaproteobacteria bacterium]|nr:MAG: homoserine kinase [Zetaproteobacteria bacterium]